MISKSKFDYLDNLNQIDIEILLIAIKNKSFVKYDQYFYASRLFEDWYERKEEVSLIVLNSLSDLCNAGLMLSDYPSGWRPILNSVNFYWIKSNTKDRFILSKNEGSLLSLLFDHEQTERLNYDMYEFLISDDETEFLTFSQLYLKLKDNFSKEELLNSLYQLCCDDFIKLSTINDWDTVVKINKNQPFVEPLSKEDLDYLNIPSAQDIFEYIEKRLKFTFNASNGLALMSLYFFNKEIIPLDPELWNLMQVPDFYRYKKS